MAGIDTGAGHGQRDVNRELPLIPFIDFLLCLVAFLLVTAVWSQMARLETNAIVPGDETKPATERPRELHVKVRPRRFQLEWRQGGALVRATDVERKTVLVDGQPQYPDLARAIEEQWRQHGTHRAATDPIRDLAVLHTENATPYGELVAVMDAVHAPQKTGAGPGDGTRRPAFKVAFAVD